MKTRHLKKLGISLLAVSALGVFANATPVVGVLNSAVVHAEDQADKQTLLVKDTIYNTNTGTFINGNVNVYLIPSSEDFNIPITTYSGYNYAGYVKGESVNTEIDSQQEILGLYNSRNTGTPVSISGDTTTGLYGETVRDTYSLFYTPATEDGGSGATETPKDQSADPANNGNADTGGGVSDGSNNGTITPPADNANGGDNSAVTPPSDNTGDGTTGDSSATPPADNSNGGTTVTPPEDNSGGNNNATINPPSDNTGGNTSGNQTTSPVDTSGGTTGDNSATQPADNSNGGATVTPPAEQPKADDRGKTPAPVVTPKADSGAKPAETPKADAQALANGAAAKAESPAPAQKQDAVKPKEEGTSSKQTLPQTGDSASILSASLGALTVGLAGLSFRKNRYQARHGRK